MSRFHRHWIARGLLFAFLFAQGAVSLYACPGTGPPPEARAAMDAMPECDQMQGFDPAAPNLCQVHCLSERLTVDQHSQPDIEPAPLVALIAPAIDPMMSTGSLRAAHARLYPAAAPPPHAILHCSLRI